MPWVHRYRDTAPGWLPPVVIAVLSANSLLVACSSDEPGSAPVAAADTSADTYARDQEADDGSSGDVPTGDVVDTEPHLDAAVPEDPPLDDGDVLDTPTDEVVCPDPFVVDYSCMPDAPETCPGGFCVFGQCIAPVVDEDRWADCGDGICGPCEGETTCPADCGQRPTRTGALAFDPDTTITVEVHGFRSVSDSEFDRLVYGSARGGGELGDLVRRYQPGLPSGLEAPEAPNQFVGVEYYGAVPADYLTADEVAEIESYSHSTEQALHRYALIVAHFIAHRLEETGATHVNLVCHSK